MTLRIWLFFNAAVRAGRVVVWLAGGGLLKVAQRVVRSGLFRPEPAESDAARMKRTGLIAG